MSRRTRRNNTPEPRATASRSAPLHANRGTFRVAQALEEAGRALGPLLRRPGDRPRDARPLTVDPVQPVERAPARRQPPPRPDAQLSMRKPETATCKARPSGESRSGGGTGRPFVPWCRK